MIHLNFLRENPDYVIERLKIKNFDAYEYVQHILSYDKQRRKFQKQLDDNFAEQNKIAKEIGKLYKEGKKSEAETLKEKASQLKNEAKKIEENFTLNEKATTETLILLPNIPHESVPQGKSAEDNEIVFTEGDTTISPNLLPHWDLCEKLSLIDFEIGAKLTGSGFPVYIGKMAKLQRAIINFFLDNALAEGYIEVQTPYVVNEESAYATGQLPDKDSQMYHVEKDNLFLIPTAEVPVTNIYRDSILKAEELPIKHCAYSACFRREAGSYGKDVRGLNRLHQFDKVEIVQITKPEDSYDTLEEMKTYVTSLLRKLELPFRILRLCGGDISFTSALTFDFEVFSKGQQKWLEVSSVSNFENFQANRMKLRYKDNNGKTHLLHTLNGSALALPRIIAALLENNQTAEGKIHIPKSLQPYTGFDYI